MQPTITIDVMWKQILRTAFAVTLIFVSIDVTAQFARKLAPTSQPSSLPATMSAQSIHSTRPAAIPINESLTRVLNFSANETSGNPENAAARRDGPLQKGCADLSQSVCYDYRRNQIVVPGTKQWMPEFPGMKKESLTNKRDKVAFNYSF